MRATAEWALLDPRQSAQRRFFAQQPDHGPV